jgi:hypothetical protein
MSSDPYKNPSRKYSAKRGIPAFPRSRSYKPFGGPHTPLKVRTAMQKLPRAATHPVLAKGQQKTAKQLAALAKLKNANFSAQEQRIIRGLAVAPRYIAAEGGIVEIVKGPKS